MDITTMNLQQLCLESQNLDKSVPLKIEKEYRPPSEEACEHYLDKTKKFIKRYSKLTNVIKMEVIEENVTKAVENFEDAILYKLQLPLEIYQLFKVPSTDQFVQEYRANIGRTMNVLKNWMITRQVWSDKLKTYEADLLGGISENYNRRKANLVRETQLQLDCLTYFEVKEMLMKEGKSLVETWNWWKNTIHHNFHLTFKGFHNQWPAWLDLNAFQGHVNVYNYINTSLNNIQFDWNSIQTGITDFDREMKKSRDMMWSFGISAQVGGSQESIAIAHSNDLAVDIQR